MADYTSRLSGREREREVWQWDAYAPTGFAMVRPTPIRCYCIERAEHVVCEGVCRCIVRVPKHESVLRQIPYQTQLLTGLSGFFLVFLFLVTLASAQLIAVHS